MTIALGNDLETLSVNAYSTIRDRIVTLDLAPGSLLSENQLGAALGLSRTPIREALKRLEREYLVTIMPRRGIMVTEVDLRTQLQLMEIRRGIESRLISRGTERATPAQRQEFARLVKEMEACIPGSELTRYIGFDAQFDTVIDAAAANRFLTDAMRPVHALVRRFWHTQVGTEGLKHALTLHTRVVQAAADGDADDVRARLSELYDFGERYLFDLMS
ncbi:GntR family transcriptional regulator [Acuticoccus sediminis]|uniref:GntR family transcriptional regulator n=1 Tax=Acuticoccus sediminis TaxID=2184697 RepID=UPI001CFCC0FD|nr:GntR family transcriptional regulator [Acuticoccus sediminis]